MIKIGGSMAYIDLKAIDKVIVDEASYTESESMETEINERYALIGPDDETGKLIVYYQL